jgi:hypothetical protein
LVETGVEGVGGEWGDGFVEGGERGRAQLRRVSRERLQGGERRKSL